MASVVKRWKFQRWSARRSVRLRWIYDALRCMGFKSTLLVSQRSYGRPKQPEAQKPPISLRRRIRSVGSSTLRDGMKRFALR
jgi:hypothetical protein